MTGSNDNGVENDIGACLPHHVLDGPDITPSLSTSSDREACDGDGSLGVHETLYGLDPVPYTTAVHVPIVDLLQEIACVVVPVA